MATLWRRSANGVGSIGIDLDEDALGLVQLRRTRAGCDLIAAAHLDLPEGADLESSETSRLLRGALGRRFRGRRAVAAMPRADIRLLAVNYRRRDDMSDEDIILRLTQERVSESLDDLVLDYIPVRTASEKNGEYAALVTVAKRSRVWALLEMLRRAGLRSDALEVAPTALRRLIAFASRDREHRNSVVIRSFGDRSTMLLLWGRRLLMHREIDFSDSAVIEQVGKSLDLPPSTARSLLEEQGVAWDGEPGAPGGLSELRSTIQEIVRPELRRLIEPIDRASTYLASRTHGEAVEQTILLGAINRWPQVRDTVDEVIERPVDALSLSACLGVSDGVSLPDRLDIAAGVALRGIDGDA